MRLAAILGGLAALIASSAFAQGLLVGVGGHPAGAGVTIDTNKGVFLNFDTALVYTSGTLPTLAGTLGVTNGKTLTVSYWTWGVRTNSNNTLAQNNNFGDSYGAGGCDAGSGNYGLCLTFDSSTSKSRLYFADGTGGTGTFVDFNGISTQPAATYLPPGQWTHYLISFDTVNQVGAVYINGVLQSANYTNSIPLNIIPDLNNTAKSTGYVIWSTGSQHDWGYLDQYWIGEESIVCTGVGAPFADCAAANTIPPSKLGNFVNGTGTSAKPVYLGANGSLPTGRQPEIFLTGDGSAFLSNAGTATSLRTLQVTGPSTDSDYRLFIPPYGPSGLTPHVATAVWTQQAYNATATCSTTCSVTASNGGMPITAGDFLMLSFQMDSSSVAPAPVCPSGWTSQASGLDTNWNQGVLICTKTGDGTETGPVITTSATTVRTTGWVYQDYGATVASVDKHACSVNASSTTLTTPAATTTASANETVVSVFFQGNAGTKTFFTPPATGMTRARTVVGAGAPAMVGVVDEYVTASGSSTTRTETMSAADTSVGCTISLVPS